jgi:Fic-DOC domain mobile mystery protein B
MGYPVKFEYPEGATPLDRGEIQGLKLPHITSRGQLNQWEQENILEARRKFFGRKQKDILSMPFMLRLHKAMFGKVWKWAGKLRTSDKNIGVAHWDVGAKVSGLCEDARLWVQSGRDTADDIAALFHHRLVSIHPFANGNGRHARMMADLLLVHVFGKEPFSWGSRDLADPGEARRLYLSALRAADARDFGPLRSFVRS